VEFKYIQLAVRKRSCVIFVEFMGECGRVGLDFLSVLVTRIKIVPSHLLSASWITLLA
jgi:hypothetical protein